MNTEPNNQETSNISPITTHILQVIPSFDFFYEMSDDHSVWLKWATVKRDIYHKLEQLDLENLLYIQAELVKMGHKTVYQNGIFLSQVLWLIGHQSKKD
jgi:hypothetical protein